MVLTFVAVLRAEGSVLVFNDNNFLRGSGRLLNRELRRSPNSPVVNWSGSPVDDIEVLNCYTSSDKLEQLERLTNADVPTVLFDREYQPFWWPRSRYHREGRDFSVGVDEPCFYTEPCRSVGEWRLHVFRKPYGRRGMPQDYHVVRMGWKECVIQNYDEYPIRSRGNGWRIKYFSTPLDRRPRLQLIARWAVAVQGWDFGAVDVLATRGDHEPYRVLEVNSCPGLRDQATLEAYVDSILSLGWRRY